MNKFLYAIYNDEMILVKTFWLSKKSRRLNENNHYRVYYKGYWIFDTQPEYKENSLSLKKAA